jgi:hypothetical protein
VRVAKTEIANEDGYERKLLSQSDVLQVHVVGRILQVPLVIDEPLVTSHVSIDIAVGSSSKSSRRGQDLKLPLAGGWVTSHGVVASERR